MMCGSWFEVVDQDLEEPDFKKDSEILQVCIRTWDHCRCCTRSIIGHALLRRLAAQQAPVRLALLKAHGAPRIVWWFARF